jgi:YafQ family addiction module toxin component
MYKLKVDDECNKIFAKLSKKNSVMLDIIHNKILEICSYPFHEYKFLHKPLEGYNRIHVDKHFILIFKIDHVNECVRVYRFGHHDYIYK